MIKVRIIFQVMGWPPEVLNNTLKKVVDQIRNSWKIVSEEYSKPEKVEETEKMYSSFVEFVAEAPDYMQLFTFVLNYAPSVVEVLEPQEIVIPISQLQDSLADLTAKLQELDKRIKILSAENVKLKSNLPKPKEGPKRVKLEFKK